MSAKIIDKMNALLAAEEENAANLGSSFKGVWYSYEYFPPKTPAGKYQLVKFLIG